MFDDFLAGGTYPCLTSRVAQDWSPGTSGPGGASFGITKNRAMSDAHDYLYVGIRSPENSGGCSDEAGASWCFGAARVDLSAGSFTRSWNTNHYGTAVPKAVDVLGKDDDIVVAEKSSEAWYQHNYSNSAVDWSNTGATEITKLAWLDNPYFVATVAGSETMGGSCPGGSPTWEGQLWIGKLGDTDTTYVDAEVVGGANSGSKPEGVSVAPIDGAHSASCDSDADYVVYVGDYCQSRLYVYTVDIDASPPALTYETDISLEVDSTSNSSIYAGDGDCEPSTAAWYPDTGNVFMLCQTRSTILEIQTGADQCDPTWTAQADEVQLKKWSSTAPDCSHNATITDCSADDCEPHDIAWDANIWPGWIFMNLSGTGDVLAMEDDLTDQRVIYHDGSAFRPQELELAPSCNPNDEAWVYP